MIDSSCRVWQERNQEFAMGGWAVPGVTAKEERKKVCIWNWNDSFIQIQLMAKKKGLQLKLGRFFCPNLDGDQKKDLTLNRHGFHVQIR